MKIKLIIGIDGSIGIEVAEGTFDEAKNSVEKVLDLISATTTVTDLGAPEQHRHDSPATENEHTHALK